MSEMNDLGVVGALRLPVPVERNLRSVPRLAWVFVAAAVIDLVDRIVSASDADGLILIGFVVLPFFAVDLLILLPAVVLVRRPMVRSDAPWIFWGVVLIAIGTLIHPASLIADRLGQLDTSGSLSPVHMILTSAPWVIGAVGWLCLAAGFLPLRARRARPGVSILAGLAIVPIAGVVVVDLPITLEFLSSAWPDSSVAIGAFGALLLSTLGKGALVWLFIRGAGTPANGAEGTPASGAEGTPTGAIPGPALLAAALWAILTVIEAANRIAVSSFTPTEALAPLYSGASVILFVLTPTALVAAFALGLVSRVVEPEPRSTGA